jgi:hypothetical protein
MAEIVRRLRVFRDVQGRWGTLEIIWWSGLNRDLAAFCVMEGQQAQHGIDHLEGGNCPQGRLDNCQELPE